MDEENRTKGVVAAKPAPVGETDAIAAELLRLKREVAIDSRIAEIFLRVADDEMYGEVLQVILEATGSKHGVFGYIDEEGDLVCPSMTRDVWQQCRIPDKSIKFPRTSWTDALWCRALRSNRILCENRPGRVPEGHVPIARSVSVPIAFQGSVIGLLQIANKASDYAQEDVRLLKGIARHIAPILHARLERDQKERERRRAHESLEQIEWMLRERVPREHTRGTRYSSPYGDVTSLNTSREVMDSVGEDVLESIVHDYLDLLETSAAVCERKGDYAFGILSSSWCRLLDNASRELCQTEDNRKALACGKWLCHESCWTDASKVAIERGQLVDIECHRGIRLVAVPIWAGDEIVGSVNLGHGDPPKEPEKLRQIAEKYNLQVDQLLKEAKSYNPRPAYLIELAKRRLASGARLIGALVERKRAEAALKEGEQRFRAIFEQAAVGVAQLETSTDRFVRVNQKYCDIAGLSAEEMKATTFLAITHPDDVQQYLVNIKRLKKGEIREFTMEKRVYRKDSVVIWVRLTASPMWSTGEELTYHVAVAEDITERKRAEEELEDVARFPTESPHPVLRVARDGAILYANAAAKPLSSGVAKGANEVPATPWRALTVRALESGTTQQVEISREENVFSFSVVPIPRGEYANWYGRDVTEQRKSEREARKAQSELLEQQRSETARVEAELEKVREELVRKTRLAAVGQVSASIAHDLRNPLGSVRNAAFYLKRHVPKDPPELAEFLGIIENEVDDADHIISSLLELTRSRPVNRQSVDLRHLVEEAFSRSADSSEVRCRISTDPDPFQIRVDPDQFRQVFINLAKNSIEAMDGKGKLFVQASRGANCDVIVVGDDGPGVPGNVREKLFEPLVTTKAKGTGLGLTICRLTVERHGGTIELMADERPGAAFQVSLPREEQPIDTE